MPQLTRKGFSSIFPPMPIRKVYLLSPRDFSPETIAVAFAKTSRSPDSFSEIAAGLTNETSAKFHEQWVVGYGHASVAEHAILHIALENVSRLAVECIESNRLASYTEKSTRYQKWDADHFFIPAELEQHPLRDDYIQACRSLFEAYARSLVPVRLAVASRNPAKKDETDSAYEHRIRSQYVDACRFLLPAASLANLGMTINARSLEYALCKMLSHPLSEVREIGEQVREMALQEVPTLVKYAAPIPSLMETRITLSAAGRNATSFDSEGDWCQLVGYDPEAELKVLAAALYRFGAMSYSAACDQLQSATAAERQQLADHLLKNLGDHDIPLRELEHAVYTFDLILDQGAYAEFKRHRMMTQTPQALTTRLGYAVPRLIVDSGFEDQYRSAMESTARVFEQLSAWNPDVASYLVPNGFNRRVLFTLNLREAFAFCRLRSARNAHFSMRRVARRVAVEIQRVHPILAAFMHLPQESWQEIESSHFA